MIKVLLVHFNEKLCAYFFFISNFSFYFKKDLALNTLLMGELHVLSHFITLREL